MDNGIGREQQNAPLAGGYRASIVATMSRGLADLLLLIGRRTLKRRVEALHAAGCPTSFAQWEEHAELPEGTPNAAGVYERALAAFVPPADEMDVPFLGCGAELPPRGVPLPEPTIKAIADYLAANRECLSLLHEAAGIEDCRYRRDLKGPLPHAVGLRICARLLKLNAVFRGHQGDSDGVLQSVRDGLRLADSLRRGPVMFSHLVRIGHYAQALQGLEWTLSAVNFSDRQLSELDEMLAASTRTLNLAEVMAGERTYMIDTYNDPPEADDPLFHSPLLKLACVRRIGLIDNLDYMADSIEASQLASVQRLARFHEMEKRAENLSFIHVVIKAIAPLTTLHVEADLRLHAYFTLARTALAIERYRLTTGKPPGQLDDLVPAYLREVPTDPFDGQPIRYRRTEPGYLLHSIPEDSRDDGGREPKDVRTEPYGWRFLVTR